MVVEGLGYADPDWRQAHADLVAATLRQSVGRGRPILDCGMPVLVLSTEPGLGLPVAEKIPEPVTDQVAKAAAVVAETYKASGKPVRTQTVAEVMRLAPTTTREHLAKAEEFGLIQRIGERSGWVPPNAGTSFIVMLPFECRKSGVFALRSA